MFKLLVINFQYVKQNFKWRTIS